jgi:hypothetical protein
MPSKAIELPPQVAKAFVRDMRVFQGKGSAQAGRDRSTAIAFFLFTRFSVRERRSSEGTRRKLVTT